jgi:signal transduction histidine kinase
MALRSIRSSVTAVAVALSASVLITASMLMLVVLRSQLTDNLDESLSIRADDLSTLDKPIGVRVFPIDEDVLVQMIDANGQVIRSSFNLTGAEPIALLTPGFRTTQSVFGRSETFRILARPLSNRGSEETTLLVGVNFDDVADPVRILRNLLLFAVPLVISLLGGMTWWLTGRTLRPVANMRKQMVEITESNLGRRLLEPHTGDEIDRLARTMNQTLDRLEDVVRRQQRFIADASHELRGPLTRIRSELEVDLAHPDPAKPGVTERSVLAEAIELQYLVDDLLEMARIDAHNTDVPSMPLDLDDIVLHETRRLSDRGRVRLDTRRVSAAQVFGDQRQLSRAIRNVLENAERHANTVVTVTLSETGHFARLSVADDGAGIASELRELIFERFTRLDEARTRDTGGSGLGLAIARDVIRRHHGTIRVAETPTTEFVIELPTYLHQNHAK